MSTPIDPTTGRAKLGRRASELEAAIERLDELARVAVAIALALRFIDEREPWLKQRIAETAWDRASRSRLEGQLDLIREIRARIAEALR